MTSWRPRWPDSTPGPRSGGGRSPGDSPGQGLMVMTRRKWPSASSRRFAWAIRVPAATSVPSLVGAPASGGKDASDSSRRPSCQSTAPLASQAGKSAGSEPLPSRAMAVPSGSPRRPSCRGWSGCSATGRSRDLGRPRDVPRGRVDPGGNGSGDHQDRPKGDEARRPDRSGP